MGGCSLMIPHLGDWYTGVCDGSRSACFYNHWTSWYSFSHWCSHSKAPPTPTTITSTPNTGNAAINNIGLLKVLIVNFITFNDFIRILRFKGLNVIKTIKTVFLSHLSPNDAVNDGFLSFIVLFTLKLLRSEILINNETLMLNFLNFIEIDVINVTLYGLLYDIIKIFI